MRQIILCLVVFMIRLRFADAVCSISISLSLPLCFIYTYTYMCLISVYLHVCVHVATHTQEKIVAHWRDIDDTIHIDKTLENRLPGPRPLILSLTMQPSFSLSTLSQQSHLKISLNEKNSLQNKLRLFSHISKKFIISEP